MKKALIAMSGGVDSSVAACLMKEKGYLCTGCTMRLYENDLIGEDLLSTCCSLKDTGDARSVCERLGIDYRIYHYEREFLEEVVDPFVRSYEEARTPNPCIDCNRRMKFGILFDRMKAEGFDTLVTGHYARIVCDEESGRYLLKKGKDISKDQSYVLYQMTQEQLAATEFPLGEYSKEEARKLAEERGFRNAKKADSQDICFIPDGDYAAFIENYTGKRFPEGDFVGRDGEKIGTHRGIIHYTIGQRKGLGIASEAPYYVTGIDPEKNRVTLSHGEGLFTDTVIAHDINLISVPEIRGEQRIKAKVRYRQTEQPGTLTQPAPDTLRIVFDEPQRAVTAGQSLVIYDGDCVVGGGIIATAEGGAREA